MRIVGGRLSGRRFGAPGGRGTRPTSDRVREGVASALESRGILRQLKNARFEALSRGASHAVVVDRDPRAVRQISQSAEDLGLGAQVRTARVNLLADPEGVVRKLPSTDAGFTLVFADPPYSEIDAVLPLLAALAASGQLAPGAWVVIERPATYDWSWPNGLAPEADYRYGQTGISLGVYAPEKGRQ